MLWLFELPLRLIRRSLQFLQGRWEDFILQVRTESRKKQQRLEDIRRVCHQLNRTLEDRGSSQVEIDKILHDFLISCQNPDADVHKLAQGILEDCTNTDT